LTKWRKNSLNRGRLKRQSPHLEIGRGKEVGEMAVEKVGEKYRCNICGNEVVVTKVGGGTLVCCGQDMKKIG